MRTVIYNEDSAKIDNGLFFGRGVFETILIKDRPIFLKEHINRLNDSIKALKLGDEVLLGQVEEFINKEDIKNKALKIIVTEENLIYKTREIKYKKENYMNGFNVRISEVLRNSTSRVVNFKTLNYLENIIEYELCQRDGFNEAVFLNEKGFIAEGCTSNIFIISDDCIYTPRKENGLLPGIVRQWVIDNFDVKEEDITKDKLLNSDEVFLTNSLVGVIKVSKLDNKLFDCKMVEEIKEQYDKAINGGMKDE